VGDQLTLLVYNDRGDYLAKVSIEDGVEVMQ